MTLYGLTGDSANVGIGNYALRYSTGIRLIGIGYMAGYGGGAYAGHTAFISVRKRATRRPVNTMCLSVTQLAL